MSPCPWETPFIEKLKDCPTAPRLVPTLISRHGSLSPHRATGISAPGGFRFIRAAMIPCTSFTPREALPLRRRTVFQFQPSPVRSAQRHGRLRAARDRTEGGSCIGRLTPTLLENFGYRTGTKSDLRNGVREDADENHIVGGYNVFFMAHQEPKSRSRRIFSAAA